MPAGVVRAPGAGRVDRGGKRLREERVQLLHHSCAGGAERHHHGGADGLPAPAWRRAQPLPRRVGLHGRNHRRAAGPRGAARCDAHRQRGPGVAGRGGGAPTPHRMEPRHAPDRRSRQVTQRKHRQGARRRPVPPPRARDVDLEQGDLAARAHRRHQGSSHGPPRRPAEPHLRRGPRARGDRVDSGPGAGRGLRGADQPLSPAAAGTEHNNNAGEATRQHTGGSTTPRGGGRTGRDLGTPRTETARARCP